MLSKPSLFTVLGSIECIESLIEKVKQITPGDWLAWEDRKVFHTQKDSNSIPIFNLPDRENAVFKDKIFGVAINQLLERELQECYRIIEEYCPGEPKRVMLVSLPGGCNVKEHIDRGYHLENCHRIHVPIITNSEVLFLCDGVRVPMNVGSVVDFNNNTRHEVINKSLQNRIHLIIDWGKKNDVFYMG
jgi:hypothetical protein